EEAFEEAVDTVKQREQSAESLLEQDAVTQDVVGADKDGGDLEDLEKMRQSMRDALKRPLTASGMETAKDVWPDLLEEYNRVVGVVQGRERVANELLTRREMDEDPK